MSEPTDQNATDQNATDQSAGAPDQTADAPKPNTESAPVAAGDAGAPYDAKAAIAELAGRFDAFTSNVQDTLKDMHAQLVEAVDGQRKWTDELVKHRETIDSHAESFNKGLSDAVNAKPDGDVRPETGRGYIEQRIDELERDVKKLKAQVKHFA